MKTHTKLACFVLLGLVASGICLVLLTYAIEMAFPKMEGSEVSPLLAFFVSIPFSFLVGGIVTGYLSYPILKSKWGIFSLAPGLYFPILLIFTVPLSGIVDFILTVLYWYLASLIGVALGYFPRVLIGRLRHSN